MTGETCGIIAGKDLDTLSTACTPTLHNRKQLYRKLTISTMAVYQEQRIPEEVLCNGTEFCTR
jgi:hypothetical protein